MTKTGVNVVRLKWHKLPPSMALIQLSTHLVRMQWGQFDYFYDKMQCCCRFSPLPIHNPSQVRCTLCQNIFDARPNTTRGCTRLCAEWSLNARHFCLNLNNNSETVIQMQLHQQNSRMKIYQQLTGKRARANANIEHICVFFWKLKRKKIFGVFSEPSANVRWRYIV